MSLRTHVFWSWRACNHFDYCKVGKACLCLLFIHPPAHGSEVSPAARNTLDSARIPTASKLLICGLFQKGRVLAQDGIWAKAKFYKRWLDSQNP